MKRYLILLGALLCSFSGAKAQEVANGNVVQVTGTGVQAQCTNDGTTGTTINLLAKAVTTGCIKAAITDTNVPVWVVTSASATTGSASLAVSGQVLGVMDNTIASGGEGYYVIASVTTAGRLHAQSAQPTGVFIVGSLISDSTTAGSTATIQVLSTFNPAAGTSSPTIEAYAGDGSDGAVTADGTTTLTCLGAPAATVYTLTRDCMFTTLVVNTSTTIKTANFRLLASTSILNNGTISNNGNNGSNGGNAVGATGGSAGAAGTITSVGSLTSNLAGKIGVVGATGVTTAATGAAGTAGTAAGISTSPLVATGTAGSTAGGAGGSSVGGANAGGAGGTGAGASGGATASKTLPRTPGRAEFLYTPLGVGYTPANIVGGPGSGGAGAGDGTNAGGGGGGSAGGGASGSFIVLISPTITNSATGLITSTGGNGGTGGNGANGVGGNAGGGGGASGGSAGSGGAVVYIYTTLTETTAATAAAGTGGAAGTHGNGVGTGANGVDGGTGAAGIAGSIWKVQLP